MIFIFVFLFLWFFFIIQSIAFITLYERHLLGRSQNRLGPTKVVFFGFFQAIIDGIKLLKKEQLMPLNSSELSFLIVPCISFLVMFFEWSVLPYYYCFIDFGFSILFFFCLIGFSVYTIIISGIVSNSKYGIIGAIRASGQSVSYEIAFSLYVLCLVIHINVFNFSSSFLFSLVFIYILFFFIVVAELNRAPFDFSEGESELVRGYNVEFSSVSFVLLFLSEYGSLIFFRVIFSVFFFDFSLLYCFFIFRILIFVRRSYPRYRYDKMISFFWFKVLPISLIFLFFYLILYF